MNMGPKGSGGRCSQFSQGFLLEPRRRGYWITNPKDDLCFVLLVVNYFNMGKVHLRMKHHSQSKIKGRKRGKERERTRETYLLSPWFVSCLLSLLFLLLTLNFSSTWTSSKFSFSLNEFVLIVLFLGLILLYKFKRSRKFNSLKSIEFGRFILKNDVAYPFSCISHLFR